MPSITLTIPGYTLVDEDATLPSAVVTPASQEAAFGEVIRLDGRSSRTQSGQAQFTWQVVRRPLGSTDSGIIAVDDDDGALVEFLPDIKGTYHILLTVQEGPETSQALARVSVRTAATAPTLRTTPDGSIFFRMLSSFWDRVEDTTKLSTVWSAFMQEAGNALHRLYGVSRLASISTAQQTHSYRWVRVDPLLEMDPRSLLVYLVRTQRGDDAYTLPPDIASRGLVTSAVNVRVLDGAVSKMAVGTELEITSGANAGIYRIDAVNTPQDGYVVSPPLPAPNNNVVFEDTSFVFSIDSAQVRALSSAVDLPAQGVQVGQFLLVRRTGKELHYKITAVGTTDGLPGDHWMRLDRPAPFTAIDVTIQVRAVDDINTSSESRTLTRSVIVPRDSLDPGPFRRGSVSGDATIVATDQLRVQPGLVTSVLVGKTATLLFSSGPARYTIVGVDSNSGTLILGKRLPAGMVGKDVRFSVANVVSERDFLLTVGHQTTRIRSIREVRVSPSVFPSENAWVIRVDTPVLAGLSGETWSIGSVVRSKDAATDFARDGVSEGDSSWLRIRSQGGSRVYDVPLKVLGAAGRLYSFDLGTSGGALSEDEQLQLIESLGLEEDPSSLKELVQSVEALSSYEGMPLTSSSVLQVGDYSVSVSVHRVVRNNRVPVPDHIVSVPSLFQYPSELDVTEIAEGGFVQIQADNQVAMVGGLPKDLLEGDDYSLVRSSQRFEGLAVTGGSDIVSAPTADLYERGVLPGDILTLESGPSRSRLIIVSFLGGGDILVRPAEGSSLPVLTKAGVSFSVERSVPGSFIQFRPGRFGADNPVPTRMWATLVIADASEDLFQSLGTLVGISPADLRRAGLPPGSYRNAVLGAMYLATGTHSLGNIATAAHLLATLPVVLHNGIISQIDRGVTVPLGTRILVRRVDREGNPLDQLDSYSVPERLLTDDLSPFFGLALNPRTGEEYRVGDTVMAMSPLSRAIKVEDYLTEPLWWVGGTIHEIEKYHTWEVQVDLGTVPSTALPLITRTLVDLRPIYTRPEVTGVLYLESHLEVETSISLEVDMYLYDDPAHSIEATHMLDSYNGSSLAQRALDLGSMSTPTVLEGYDLEVVAPNMVRSARGGFLGNTVGTLPHSTLPVGEIEPNPWFTDPVHFRGTRHIRTGDLLFITHGPNRGRYRVSTILSDDMLSLSAAPAGTPPLAPDPADLVPAEDQRFQVQRVDQDLLFVGVAAVISSSASSSVIEADGAVRSMLWDGVTVDDYLVVEDGPLKGRYKVQAVLPDSSEHYIRVQVEGDLSSLASATPFTIRRDALKTNPIWEGDATLTEGSQVVELATDALREGVRQGDVLVVGSLGGVPLPIIAVSDNGEEIFLGKPAPATVGPVAAEVVRPEVQLAELRDADQVLELVTPLDETEFKFFEPRAVISSVTDAVVTAGSSIITSATADFVDDGVEEGMEVELLLPSGEYLVGYVVSFGVSFIGIDQEVPVSATGLSLEVWGLDGQFDIVDDHEIEYQGTINLETGPDLTIGSTVSGATFTGGSATVTGSGTAFLTGVSPGQFVRGASGGDYAFVRVRRVVSDTELELERPYSGSSGAQDLEILLNNQGFVLPGDIIEVDTLPKSVILRVEARTIFLVEV